MFCNMPKDCVFENQNARSLYEVPLLLHAEHLDDKVLELLRIDAPEADLAEWRAMVERQLGCKEKVNIALVGKYVELPDAYLSVVEALEHGGIFHGVKAHILWIAAETVTDENAAELLKDADGLVVPAASVPADWKVKWPRSATRGRMVCPSWACALECRWP